MLLEESNLAKVADPAAGSGGIEALTERLCVAAWAQFQQLDKAGGAWSALEQGLIQKDVATVRAERQKAVARRKDAITGASDYPHLGEKPAGVLKVAPVAPAQEPEAKTVCEPLPSIRLAEPFELLRDKSDERLKKIGARPKVFLATLGKLSDFSARATYAKNFYETGGIETLSGDGYKDQAEMIAAFKKSSAKLACLCGADATYAEEAVGAAKGLTEAGAIVHLAGRPRDIEAALQQAGVKAFIFVGCDVLATLQASHDILQ